MPSGAAPQTTPPIAWEIERSCDICPRSGGTSDQPRPPPMPCKRQQSPIVSLGCAWSVAIKDVPIVVSDCVASKRREDRLARPSDVGGVAEPALEPGRERGIEDARRLAADDRADVAAGHGEHLF